MLLHYFGCLSIVLSVMPDLQMIVKGKDSNLGALAFQIGYSKAADWLASFLVLFLFSIFPYFGFSLMVCYWFRLKGADLFLF
jgi:hypothetical protein